jgi:hypothetical protein
MTVNVFPVEEWNTIIIWRSRSLSITLMIKYKLLFRYSWISGKLCIYWICILKQYIFCSITMYLILAKNDYTCWYKSYHDILLINSMLWKMSCNNLYLHLSTQINIEAFNECMLPLRLWLDSCSWRGVYICVPTHGMFSGIRW